MAEIHPRFAHTMLMVPVGFGMPLQIGNGIMQSIKNKME